jgi:ABC-2 type transport system permease protein
VKSLTRTFSFFNQWTAEVLRQPWLMVVLVIGPFLIRVLFGFGEVIGAPKPRTILVTSPGAQQSTLQVLPQDVSQYLNIVATTSDEQQARAELAAERADLVVVVPPDPTGSIEQGQQAPIRVRTNEIDPVRLSYADSYLSQQVDLLNQETVRKAVASAQSQVGDIHGYVAQAQQYLRLLGSAPNTQQAAVDLGQLQSSLDQLSTTLHQALSVTQNSPLIIFPGLTQPLSQLQATVTAVDDLRAQVQQLNAALTGAGAPTSLSPQDIQRIQTGLTRIDQTATQLKTIPAGVLAAPFSLQLQNIAPWRPQGSGFYAPAMLALIVQHVGVTLGALSMSRMRLLGLTELFQVAPVRAGEVALGNYFSYGALSVVVAGALLGLILGLLGIPVFGPAAALAAVLLLLVAASVGIGLFISLVSSSEQHAAQIAMLVLIASVFFSGLLVSLDTIIWPVRIVSYLLPATYAIRTLDDILLRGILHTPLDLAMLAGFALFFFALSTWRFGYELRPR